MFHHFFTIILHLGFFILCSKMLILLHTFKGIIYRLVLADEIMFLVNSTIPFDYAEDKVFLVVR